MMTPFIVYSQSSGEILRAGRCEEAVLQLQAIGTDEAVIAADATELTHYVAPGGTLVQYTTQQAAAKSSPPPYPAHWSNQTMTWVDDRSLPQVREDQWRLIKAARDAAEWGGFDTPFGRFDSDPNSQAKIIGAAQLASIALAQGAPFGIEWTLQDNTSVHLDAAQMVAVGAALANHVNAVHQRGRQLRAQIEAAATIADLESIAWTP